MKIVVTSVPVDDQDKALRFYTETLGFVVKENIDVGGAKWLTVVAPDDQDGTELLLEPDNNPEIQIDGKPAAQVYKRVLFDAGIPYTMFGVDDVHKEYERLTAQGVEFNGEPTSQPEVTTAVFNDTCGNLIMIASKP